MVHSRTEQTASKGRETMGCITLHASFTHLCLLQWDVTNTLAQRQAQPAWQSARKAEPSSARGSVGRRWMVRRGAGPAPLLSAPPWPPEAAWSRLLLTGPASRSPLLADAGRAAQASRYAPRLWWACWELAAHADMQRGRLSFQAWTSLQVRPSSHLGAALQSSNWSPGLDLGVKVALSMCTSSWPVHARMDSLPPCSFAHVIRGHSVRRRA